MAARKQRISVVDKDIIAAAGCSSQKFKSACNLMREICQGQFRRVDRCERVSNRYVAPPLSSHAHAGLYLQFALMTCFRALVDRVAAARDVEDFENEKRNESSMQAFREHAAARCSERPAKKQVTLDSFLALHASAP
jgi:hypothetical protein